MRDSEVRKSLTVLNMPLKLMYGLSDSCYNRTWEKYFCIKVNDNKNIV